VQVLFVCLFGEPVRSAPAALGRFVCFLLFKSSGKTGGGGVVSTGWIRVGGGVEIRCGERLKRACRPAGHRASGTARHGGWWAPPLQLPAHRPPPAGSVRDQGVERSLLLPTPDGPAEHGQALACERAQASSPSPVDRLTLKASVAPGCGARSSKASTALRGPAASAFENHQLDRLPRLALQQEAADVASGSRFGRLAATGPPAESTTRSQLGTRLGFGARARLWRGAPGRWAPRLDWPVRIARRADHPIHPRQTLAGRSCRGGRRCQSRPLVAPGPGRSSLAPGRNWPCRATTRP